MYLLTLFCENSGVLRVIYFMKILFNIILVVLPLIVIITSTISIFKVVMDGKSDTMKASILQGFKKIVASLIVILIPSVMNYIFTSLVDMDLDFATCYTNAELDYIKEKEKEEKQQRDEEYQKRLQERAEYEALQKAKHETMLQSKEEYNTGGELSGEIITSGTEGIYFAPLQNSKGGSSASVTGGCSNETPVYHDVYASIGTPVYAPYDGTARYIQSNCNGVLYSFGNQVRVYKEDSTYITYAHFSKFPEGIEMPITEDCPYKSSSGSKCGAGHCASGMTSTKIAEVKVKRGQLIGYTGTTGNSLGPHLHVEIHEKGSSACVTDPWAAFGMR